jgi:hypothetical protein
MTKGGVVIKSFLRGLIVLTASLLVVCGQQYQFGGDVSRNARGENFVIRDECQRPEGEQQKPTHVPITIKIGTTREKGEQN